MPANFWYREGGAPYPKRVDQPKKNDERTELLKEGNIHFGIDSPEPLANIN